MSDHHPTIQEIDAPLQRPPTFMGKPAMLISLFLGLPIVSTAIFGAGLWLGRQWDRPASVSPLRPDARLSAAPVSATHLPAAPARQQPAQAPSRTTVLHRSSDPAPRDPEAIAGRLYGLWLPQPTPVMGATSEGESVAPQPSEPVVEVVTSATLPSDLWPDRFKPDVEGWRVVKDSKDPDDLADFVMAFPMSHFAVSARARLHQLQRQNAPASSNDLREPERPRTTTRQQTPSPSPPPITPLQIRYAQINLRLAGFDPGPIDDICGPQTLATLRQYQASRELPVTGLLDATTQQALQMPSHAVLAAWQRARRSVPRTPVMTVQSRERAPQAQPRHDLRALRPEAQAESEF